MFKPRKDADSRKLNVETLESRLNLSAFTWQTAPAAANILNPTRIVGSVRTNTLSLTAIGDSAPTIGATVTPLSANQTSVPVPSYSAIANCSLEYLNGQPDIGYVSASGATVDYLVSAPADGAYTINLGFASYSGAHTQILVNGNAAGMVTAPSTASWTNFTTATTSIQLSAGANTIEFKSLDGTQYNLGSISLAPAGFNSTPPSPGMSIGDNTAIDVTTYTGIYKSTLEYQGANPDIGYVVGNGSYVEYTINVQTAGTYSVNLGVAGPSASTIGISSNGNSLGAISASSTNSWTVFQTFSQNVTLAAGLQTLRFTSINSQYNIGAIQLTRQTPPAPTLPPATITQRWMTSFNEIDVVGTSGNDSIYVSQSGSILTITTNGQSQQVAANGELVIWGGDGNDTITVDSSVTLDTRLYGGNGNNTLVNKTSGQATIVSIGGGADTLTGNGINTSFWADNTDIVNASPTEVAIGGVHVVNSFYGGVPLALNSPNLADPASTGAGWTRLTSNSFFGLGPSQFDINQGQASDCYYLAPLSDLARMQPGALRQLGVDLGDGTYAIQYKRNGVTTYVRVDGDLPTASWGGLYYAHPGASGNQWVAIFEKAYAFFRTGSASYSSLNFGFMNAVYNDFGIAATSIAMPSDQNTFYNIASAKLAANKGVDFATASVITNGAPLIAGHAYSLTNIWKDASGTVWVTLRNPWGFDGVGNDSNIYDGFVTMTYSSLLGGATTATLVS